MLFSSAGFVFILLPLTLAVFALAVRLRLPAAAMLGLLAASYIFYGWWQPSLSGLLALSTAFNYMVGNAIARDANRAQITRVRLLLCLGIAANLALLGYFKYAAFFVTNINELAGTHIPLLAVALPIGISFYTFTQIAFLVDAARGLVTGVRPLEYFLFVSYFPHLVAGPIIHHRDVIPQFRRLALTGWDTTSVAAGLSIFTVGLFKKVVVADSFAPFADAAFSQVTHEALSMQDSWIGVLAYTLQIYFDFSAYSDMAIGLSLLFGVRLPLNFFSPYKATSIIEFWSRWHISLSRFLRDYLYIPLGGNRKGSFRRYFNLMATMLIGGLWHGAGWTFVVWGGVHGAYLTINHALRLVRPVLAEVAPWMRWCKQLTVFVAVAVAWVFFRANSLVDALTMLSGMCGAHGWRSGNASQDAVLWIGAGLFAVWAMPNTYELFARSSPVLPLPSSAIRQRPSRLAWQMSAIYAIATGAALAGCVLAIYRPSPFLYFRF
jgi:alginate O-acetyltransferase complex protein AlgI